MEYMNISKITDYNDDVRNAKDEDNKDNHDDESFPLHYNGSYVQLKDIKLFQGAWKMSYDYDSDQKIVQKYLKLYMDDDNEDTQWKKALNADNLRFNQKWLVQFINDNQNKGFIESMKRMIDEKFMKMKQLEFSLLNGKGNKRANEYWQELKRLREETKGIYQHRMFKNLDREIIFGFDMNSSKKIYSIKDNPV